MSYKNFTTEDFVQDKQFRQWVLKPNRTSNIFWHEFLTENPEKLSAIKQAKAIVLDMQFPEKNMADQDIADMWQNIKNATLSDTTSPELSAKEVPLNPVAIATLQARKLPERKNKWLKIAASLTTIALLSGLVYFYLQQHPDDQQYATAFGETKSVVLPDSSVVTLNANTKLRVPAQWQADAPRKVWLQGEAFFQVKEQFNVARTQGKRKFLVHTENLKIEVLGTEFNVNTRRSKTQVVLNTGKVKLIGAQQELTMQPGELAELTAAQRKFTKKVVNPNPYSSWKENKLICNGTSLQEIVDVMQDRFGVQAALQDPTLSNIEASGTIPLDDIEIFIAVLQKSIGLTITRQNDRIMITK